MILVILILLTETIPDQTLQAAIKADAAIVIAAIICITAFAIFS